MSHPHVPTPETTAEVELLSGFGIRQEDIGQYLGINTDTLCKYYREQLDRGVVKANRSVMRALHKNATDNNNVAAQIFWLKTRAGWREKIHLDHSSEDGSMSPQPGVDWLGYPNGLVGGDEPAGDA